MSEESRHDYIEELFGRTFALEVVVNVLATEFVNIDTERLANVIRVINELGETEYGIVDFTPSQRLGYSQVLADFVDRGTLTLTTKYGGMSG